MTPAPFCYVLFIIGIVLMLLLVHRLRRREMLYRLLAEESSDLVSLHAPDGTFQWVSPSSLRLLGYEPEELVGRDPLQIIHPEDVELILAQTGSEAPHEPLQLNYRLKSKGGVYRWFESLVKPIYNGSGKLVRFQANARDITDRQQAEDLYQYTTRNLPETAVVLFDREHRILLMDGPLVARAGLHKEDLEGQPFPPLLGSLWRRRTLYQANRALHGERFTTEFTAGNCAYKSQCTPTLDGSGNLICRGLIPGVQTQSAPRSGCFFKAHLHPVTDPSGHIVGGMAVVIDITQEKVVELALRDRTSDLEAVNQDLEQFADIASHELKAPLRRISGFAELLLDEYGGVLSNDADSYLHHITDGVEDMREVVEALLTYSRAKTIEDRMTSVDFNDLFAQVVETLGPRIREMGAEVMQSDLPTLRGDPVLLKQVLENLVWNGIKFSGDNPVVKVYAKRQLFDWEFSVEDNGPGIEPEHHERIFQMFKRSRTDVEGSGVGLALCRKIVGIHRGKIWVESYPGHGATFKFTLPARQADSPSGAGQVH